MFSQGQEIFEFLICNRLLAFAGWHAPYTCRAAGSRVHSVAPTCGESFPTQLADESSGSRWCQKLKMSSLVDSIKGVLQNPRQVLLGKNPEASCELAKDLFRALLSRRSGQDELVPAANLMAKCIVMCARTDRQTNYTIEEASQIEDDRAYLDQALAFLNALDHSILTMYRSSGDGLQSMILGYRMFSAVSGVVLGVAAAEAAHGQPLSEEKLNEVVSKLVSGPLVAMRPALRDQLPSGYLNEAPAGLLKDGGEQALRYLTQNLRYDPQAAPEDWGAGEALGSLSDLVLNVTGYAVDLPKAGEGEASLSSAVSGVTGQWVSLGSDGPLPPKEELKDSNAMDDVVGPVSLGPSGKEDYDRIKQRVDDLLVALRAPARLKRVPTRMPGPMQGFVRPSGGKRPGAGHDVDWTQLAVQWQAAFGLSRVSMWIVTSWTLHHFPDNVEVEEYYFDLVNHGIPVMDSGHLHAVGLPWHEVDAKVGGTEEGEDSDYSLFQHLLTWLCEGEARCRRLFAASYFGNPECTHFREWIPECVYSQASGAPSAKLDNWLGYQAAATKGFPRKETVRILNVLEREGLLAERQWALLEDGKLFDAHKPQICIPSSLTKALDTHKGKLEHFFTSSKEMEDSMALWGVGTGRPSAGGLYCDLDFSVFEKPSSDWFMFQLIKNINRPLPRDFVWAACDEFSVGNWQRLPGWAFRTMDGCVWSMKAPLYKGAYGKTPMDQCRTCGMWGHSNNKCRTRPGVRFDFLVPSNAGPNPEWDLQEISNSVYKTHINQRIPKVEDERGGSLLERTLELELMKAPEGLIDSRKGKEKLSAVVAQKFRDVRSWFAQEWRTPVTVQWTGRQSRGGWKEDERYPARTSHWDAKKWDTASWNQWSWGTADWVEEDRSAPASGSGSKVTDLPRKVFVATTGEAEREVESMRSIFSGLDPSSKMFQVMNGILDRVKAVTAVSRSLGDINQARAGLLKEFQTGFQVAAKELIRKMVSEHPEMSQEIFGMDMANAKAYDDLSRSLVHKIFDDQRRSTATLAKMDGQAFTALRLLGQVDNVQQAEELRRRGVGTFLVQLAASDYNVVAGAAFTGTRSDVAVTSSRIFDESGRIKAIRIEGALVVQTAVEVAVVGGGDLAEKQAVQRGVAQVRENLGAQVNRLAATFGQAIAKLDGCLETIMLEPIEATGGGLPPARDAPMSGAASSGPEGIQIFGGAGRKRQADEVPLDQRKEMEAAADKRELAALMGDRESPSGFAGTTKVVEDQGVRKVQWRNRRMTRSNRAWMLRNYDPAQEDRMQSEPLIADVQIVDTGVQRKPGSVAFLLETFLGTTVEDVESGRLRQIDLAADWRSGMTDQAWDQLKAMRARYDRFVAMKQSNPPISSEAGIVVGHPLLPKESDAMKVAFLWKDGVPVVDYQKFWESPSGAKRAGWTENSAAKDFESRYQKCYAPSALVSTSQLARILDREELDQDARRKIVQEYVVDYWTNKIPQEYRELLDGMTRENLGWLDKEMGLKNPWVFHTPNPNRQPCPSGEMLPEMWYGILKSKFQPILIVAKRHDRQIHELELTVYFQCLACGGICWHTQDLSRKSQWGPWDFSMSSSVGELEEYLMGRDLIADHMAVSDPNRVGAVVDTSLPSNQCDSMLRVMSEHYGAYGIQETYRRFHHGRIQCEYHWERYGARLCSVTGIVPEQGMRHYGLGKSGGNTRQQRYKFPWNERHTVFDGCGCRFPVKEAVEGTIGDVRSLAVLALRILESNPVRCQLHNWEEEDWSSRKRHNTPLTAADVKRVRPGLVNWDTSEEKPNYMKESTQYVAWATLPDTFEDYAEVLGVVTEDHSLVDPFSAAYARLLQRIEGGKGSDDKALRGFLLPPATGSSQWYSVVELELTEEFRTKVSLKDGVIVVICQDQLVAATEAIMKEDKYEQGSEGSMFEAWTLNTNRLRLKAESAKVMQEKPVSRHTRETEGALLKTASIGMEYLLNFGSSSTSPS